MSGRWNRIRYTLWAPFYDLVVGFGSQRRRSIELLSLQPGDRVLIVGAGTGADLPFLPPGVVGLATDLTPAMLERARPRLRLGLEVAGAPLEIVHDEPALLGGAFRVVQLEKTRERSGQHFAARHGRARVRTGAPAVGPRACRSQP